MHRLSADWLPFLSFQPLLISCRGYRRSYQDIHILLKKSTPPPKSMRAELTTALDWQPPSICISVTLLMTPLSLLLRLQQRADLTWLSINSAMPSFAIISVTTVDDISALTTKQKSGLHQQ